MAEPLEYQIVKDLQTALRSISKAGGYFHDVKDFVVKLDADHEVEELIREYAPRPFLILELPPDEFDYSGGADQLLVPLPCVIHVVTNSDPTEDDSLLKTYFRLCADVEKAIAADTDRSRLATDTRILRREMHELQGQQVWAMLTCEIREHRVYGAPNG